MDSTESIANGYKISFTSGDGIFIVYEGKERPNMIVIDARVDAFKVLEHRIYVARTPMERYMDGNSPSYRMQDKCEHWVIDTKSHVIEQTSETASLSCKLSAAPSKFE